MRIVAKVVKYGDLKWGDLFEEQKIHTPAHESYEGELLGTKVVVRLDNEWPEWLKERQVIQFIIEP